MRDRGFRRDVLISFGASDVAAEELLAYTENVFLNIEPSSSDVPGDEPFVDAWRTYAAEAQEMGAFECLRDRLIQLQFPIAEGMSKSGAYLAATRRGERPAQGDGLQLAAPEALRIEIHPSAAGHIPLLITESRSDFVALVRAFTRRNEPVEIPDSMGACMVAGYNNWDRLRTYRQKWECDNPQQPWDKEFEAIIPRKELYQDRFILLSDGPYSGVSAEAMGLPDDVWRAASLIIRREHECAHYYTRRVLGSMRNNLFDELIADYMGIVAVAGHFRADWFLRFMGLENHPHYRPGGRFENYVSGLSADSVSVLKTLVVTASFNLASHGPACLGTLSDPLTNANMLNILSSLTMEELATQVLLAIKAQQASTVRHS